MNLQDVAQLTAGHSFRGKIPEVKGTAMYIVQLKNVSPTNIDWNSCIETAIIGRAQPKFLEPDDILFIARGSNNYAVLIDEQASNIHAVAAPQFYVIKVNKNIIVPRFLAWLLNQAPIQHYFQREAEGTLTKSIRRNVLAHTPIIVPDVEVQQKIAQLATTVHQQQDTLRQLIDNGTHMMNAIAKQLLTENSHKVKQ